MSVLSVLIMNDSVWKWIHRLGGPGLILLGLADNTPFISAPAGSEDIFVILLSAHRHEWWAYYAFMATVGEVLGGYVAYRLAEKGGQETLEKKVGKPRAEKTYKYFEKRGFLTVFTGSILPPPFPFTSVLMAAGIMQFPRKKFFSALTAGRAVRFFCRGLFGQDLWPANDRLLLAALPADAVCPDRAGSDGRHWRTGLLQMVPTQGATKRKSTARVALTGKQSMIGEAPRTEHRSLRVGR